jgi:hypothetical protein
MSHASKTPDTNAVDPLESIVPVIPLVIPVAGGLMIFLLAFIAVFMA